jgi:lipopolysaccharide transport system ATP-binding protein
VKHYSSGMYTRLAFSVAAHLDPEILVVDEVLAVGDAAFQRKCLGKMGDVARQGRTILFVSHNMAAVQQLTHVCLVLEAGRVDYYGPTEIALSKYLNTSRELTSTVYDVRNMPRRLPELKKQVEFLTVEVAGPALKLIAADQPIRMNMLVRGNESIDRFRLSAIIFRVDGAPIGIGFGPSLHSIKKGQESALELTIAEHNLAPGQYYVALATGTGNHLEGHTEFDMVFDVCHFEVMPQQGTGGVQATWASVWGTIHFNNVSSNECEALVR